MIPVSLISRGNASVIKDVRALHINPLTINSRGPRFAEKEN